MSFSQALKNIRAAIEPGSAQRQGMGQDRDMTTQTADQTKETLDALVAAKVTP